MGNDVNFFDLVKFDRFVRWFRSVWAKSLFVVVAFVLGYYIGEYAVESRIIGDCKYLNAFRIDHLSYACNRRVNDR